jgi:ribonuclease P protein component
VKSIYSLKGRILFKEVYFKGRKIQGTGIRVYSLKSLNSKDVKPDRGSTGLDRKKNIKIAITLTKSFGKAHIRNKAKRRMRAICTELFDELKDGFSIIVRIDSDFKDIAFDDQRRIIISLFAKAGLFNSDAYKSV